MKLRICRLLLIDKIQRRKRSPLATGATSNLFRVDDFCRIPRRTSLCRSTQEAWGNCPFVAAVCDNRDRLLVIPNQSPFDHSPRICLKANALTNSEFQHAHMGMHLMKDPKALHDPAVQVNEFGLGELIDVESCSHAFPSGLGVATNQRRKRSSSACFMTCPPTSEIDLVKGISLGQTSTQFWA
jgi:hypothetical protein